MTTSVLGGAKVGNGLTISSEKLAVLKDPNGPVTVSASGVSVQDATTSQKGVVKIGSGLSVSGGTVSADAQTPTAGTLISVSGRQVSVKNSFNGSAPFVGFDATKGELVPRTAPLQDACFKPLTDLSVIAFYWPNKPKSTYKSYGEVIADNAPTGDTEANSTSRSNAVMSGLFDVVVICDTATMTGSNSQIGTTYSARSITTGLGATFSDRDILTAYPNSDLFNNGVRPGFQYFSGTLNPSLSSWTDGSTKLLIIKGSIIARPASILRIRVYAYYNYSSPYNIGKVSDAQMDPYYTANGPYYRWTKDHVGDLIGQFSPCSNCDNMSNLADVNLQIPVKRGTIITVRYCLSVEGSHFAGLCL